MDNRYINIGYIKECLNKKMANSLINEDVDFVDENVNNFITIISESPILKKEYDIFESILNNRISSEVVASRFIDKTISLMENYSIDEINEKQAFISIVIFDKLYWGKGIGKYVLKTFCNTIFQRYSINKLCAFTYKTNLKSVKALESVGFNIIEEFDEDGVSSYYLEMINRLISNNQNKN